MTFSFILECGPKGADAKVIPYLAKRILPNIEIGQIITLDRKDKMLPICGAYASNLLKTGSDRVLVMWDVMPRWDAEKKLPCQQDVAKARRSLSVQGVDIAAVRLICFEKELEAWVAADKRAVSAFLSRPAHPVNFPKIKNPHLRENIKGDLINGFVNCKCRGYVDLDHALGIVEKLPDLTQLRRIPSFARFESIILNSAAPCSRYLAPLSP